MIELFFLLLLCACAGWEHQSQLFLIWLAHFTVWITIYTIFRDLKSCANWAVWEKPIAGIGQGNCAGSQIWVAISSPLFAIMQSNGFFTQIACTMSTHKKDIVGFMFVNSIMDLCVSAPGSTPSHSATQLQDAVTNWEGLLKVTGSCISAQQVFWYLIYQIWLNGKWEYQTKGQPNPIPQLEVSEAWQTLRVQLALDGNSTMEFEYLQSMATKWHDCMLGAKLIHNDVVFNLCNIVMQKLIDPLTVMTFMVNQCDLIM